MRLAMLNKEGQGPKLLLDSYGKVSQREPGQDKPAIKVLRYALLSFTLYNLIVHFFCMDQIMFLFHTILSHHNQNQGT